MHIHSEIIQLLMLFSLLRECDDTKNTIFDLEDLGNNGIHIGLYYHCSSSKGQKFKVLLGSIQWSTSKR